jgi:hypothetical protein
MAATHTTVATGDWSVAETFDVGVPHDGDNVVVAAGHTLTLDDRDYTIAAGKTLTVAAGSTLTMDSEYSFTLNGTLDCSAAGAKIDANAPLLGAGGVIKLGATSACTGQPGLTSCTWTVAPGATWTVDQWCDATMGGDAANLDMIFNLAAGVFSLSGAVVRDVTLTDGTLTLTNLTCRTLTLAAAKTLNLGGFVRLGASPVLGAGTLHLTNAAIIPTASITFDAVALLACDHTTCCMFDNGAAVLIVKNLPAQTTPIQAYSCAATADGGGNAADSIVFHAHPSSVPTGSQP